MCACICVSNDLKHGNSPLISWSGLESLFSGKVCLGLWRAEREMVKEKRGEGKQGQRMKRSCEFHSKQGWDKKNGPGIFGIFQTGSPQSVIHPHQYTILAVPLNMCTVLFPQITTKLGSKGYRKVDHCTHSLSTDSLVDGCVM